MCEIKYYCKSELKELGFTDKMIKELVLREPILKQNPHYKHAAPMQLWEQSYINDIIASEAFSIAKETAKARKTASKKAVQTKRKDSMALLEAAVNSIVITTTNPINIEKWALEEKAWWDESHGYYDSNVYSADQITVNRWCVNYIRHNLTNYETVLERFKRKVGKTELYEAFRDAVMKRIANVYPQFFEEKSA